MSPAAPNYSDSASRPVSGGYSEDLRSAVLEEYVYKTFKPIDHILDEVLNRTEENNFAPIHVGGMEGLTLEIIIRMAGYKKIVEVGTLAGFSGISLARGLGSDGELHTIELDPRKAALAEESFEKAGVSTIVKMHVGDGVQVLDTLAAQAPFDAIFIDCVKNDYPRYLDWAEKNIRVGGAVIADNTYCFGHVWKECFHRAPQIKPEVTAIQELNARLAQHPDFRATLLPFDKGITLAVRIR